MRKNIPHAYVYSFVIQPNILVKFAEVLTMKFSSLRPAMSSDYDVTENHLAANDQISNAKHHKQWILTARQGTAIKSTEAAWS